MNINYSNTTVRLLITPYFLLESDDMCIMVYFIFNYKDLNDTVIQMKEECGDLCVPHSIDIEKDIPVDKTFKRLNKSVNCNKLWGSSIFDQNTNVEFPLQKLPKYLTNYFSQNGQVRILPYYLIDTSNGEDEYMKLGKCYIIY